MFKGATLRHMIVVWCMRSWFDSFDSKRFLGAGLIVVW